MTLIADLRRKNKSLLSAISRHCMNCSGHSKKLVRECSIKQCPLYPYRIYQATKEDIENEETAGHQMRLEGL